MMYIAHYNSPFGKINITSDGTYLTGLWFADSPDSDKHGDIDSFVHADLPIFEDTKDWLEIYFHGIEPDFTPEYKIYGMTPFREQVINHILKIPHGKTTTYKAIADSIAKSKGISRMSAQAVGGAVGWNPICLIIPCHRVIGSDGSLVGYGGGIENKLALLRLEGVEYCSYAHDRFISAFIF